MKINLENKKFVGLGDAITFSWLAEGTKTLIEFYALDQKKDLLKMIICPCLKM